MKKFVVLLVVLALASMANATIMLSVNGSTTQNSITLSVGGTCMIDIYSNDSSSHQGTIAVRPANPGTLSNPVVYKPVPAGNSAGTTAVDYTGFGVGIGYDFVSAGTPVDQGGTLPSPGTHFDFLYTCTGVGTVIVDLYEGTTPVDSVTITQIPEPATMAILGLGALLLRRKK